MEASDSAKQNGHWVSLYNADTQTKKLILIKNVESWERQAMYQHFHFSAVDQSGHTINGKMIREIGGGNTHQLSTIDDWGADIPIHVK